MPPGAPAVRGMPAFLVLVHAVTAAGQASPPCGGSLQRLCLARGLHPAAARVEAFSTAAPPWCGAGGRRVIALEAGGGPGARHGAAAFSHFKGPRRARYRHGR
ncbi:hypothetical protein AVXHC19_10970 [Acidovorax sacchari]